MVDSGGGRGIYRSYVNKSTEAESDVMWSENSVYLDVAGI